jgi:hypothetical protein
MTMAVTEDNASEAARILHENQVSANVTSVHRQMNSKLWILHYAHDYLLGALILLEQAHLLRDVEQEQVDKERDQQMAAVIGPRRTPREKAYGRLLRLVIDVLPASFGAAVDTAAEVTTDDGYEAAKPRPIIAASWRHRGSTADALALARVRKLASDNWRLKTIKRADLLEALGITDER